MCLLQIRIPQVLFHLWHLLWSELLFWLLSLGLPV
jgi:hypothetical protein